MLSLVLLTSFPLGEKESPHFISRYEQSLFFTIFVWLQFWNMFNARAFKSGRSAFHFKGAKGFNMIALVILIGQVFIVTFGGEMFSVVPLSVQDWVLR